MRSPIIERGNGERSHRLKQAREPGLIGSNRDEELVTGSWPVAMLCNACFAGIAEPGEPGTTSQHVQVQGAESKRMRRRSGLGLWLARIH